MKAAGGQIWKAKDVVLAIPVDWNKNKGRRQVIEKNEMVEFRYWSPAHFRTSDGLYLWVEEKEFYQQFEFVGKIFHEINFRNQNTTKEILDCKLYEVVDSTPEAKDEK